nr:ABC transporter permease [Cyclobacteriaceae bacterium]
LVVSQFTISISLIIGTIIVFQQVQFAKDRPVGYSRSNLVQVPEMNSAIHEHYDAIKNKLVNTGLVSSIAESQSSITGIWGSTSGLSWSGKDPGLSVDFGMINSSYDYGKTVGWKVKEGRDFSREFSTDSTGIIFNQAAIDFMGMKNPVGEQVTWFGDPFTIIGVVENMIMESPYDEQRPVMYFLSEDRGNMALVRIDSMASKKEALDNIEAVFKEFNPSQPFEYEFVDDSYARKFGKEERIGKLSGLFAGLAVLICCLGIFGLASFTAEQRTKEIGIRKVLGASVVRLWQMLSVDFVALVLVSCFIAAPLSYYLIHRWLLKYEYRTDISMWVFIAAGAGAMLITLLTVSYHAIKAARANPTRSLRSE